jgi:drug/metabolite transporter (DMT)-like permease
MVQEKSRRHAGAVAGTLLAAWVWGASFAAMKFAIQARLSVGVMLSLRFAIGALSLGVLLLALKIPLRRRALLDGAALGLLLTAVFWLQADGLRFTTTAKSGFITGLYVLFTPAASLLMGGRIRPSHAMGALLATLGLFLLVRTPGAPMGGWNRGDTQTLVCAVGCGFHIVLTSIYSRRSSGWVLAFTQVLVVGALSALITAFLPYPHGYRGALRALSQPGVWITLSYLGVLATALAFYLMSTLQAHLGATEAAILYSLEPVFTALLAMSGWVPGVKERLGPLQLAGGAIILTAMILAELVPSRRARGAEPQA